MSSFNQPTNQPIIPKKDKKTQTLRSKAIKPSESKDPQKLQRRSINICPEAKGQEAEWSTMKKWGSRIRSSTQISWLLEKSENLRTEQCITSLVLDKDNRFESEQKMEAIKKFRQKDEQTHYKRNVNEKSWLRKSWNTELRKYVKSKNCSKRKKKMRRRNVNTKSSWLRSRNRRMRSWRSNLNSGNRNDRRKSKRRWRLNKRRRSKSKRWKSNPLRRTKKWNRKLKSLKKNSERNILLRSSVLNERSWDSNEWQVLLKEPYLESSLSTTPRKRSALDLKS